MRQKPVPLSFSLQIAYAINNESSRLNSYLRSLFPNHRDSFTRISGETASNPADTPLSTASPPIACRVATASHGFGLLLSLGDPWRDSVCEGLSAQGYH